MTTTPEQRTATLSELVAQEIDSVRGRKRWSQAQLARAIGKTEMWVSLRLRGKQPIDMNDLALIARALEVGVHDLLPSPEKAGEAVGTGQPNVRLSDLTVQTTQHPPISAHPPTRLAGNPPTGRTSSHTTFGVSPTAPQRRDSTRPSSPIPASKRRPTVVNPPSRPMAA